MSAYQSQGQRIDTAENAAKEFINSADQLSEEYEVYKRCKPQFVVDALGKHVLIKGTDIVGFYEDPLVALNDAYQRFGNVPFFLHEVSEEETCTISLPTAWG